MTVDPMSQDFSFVLSSAVRYALGRRTSAPSIVTTFCRLHWDQLSSWGRQTVMEDVGQAIRSEFTIATGRLGEEYDAVLWVSFFVWGVADERRDFEPEQYTRLWHSRWRLLRDECEEYLSNRGLYPDQHQNVT